MDDTHHPIPGSRRLAAPVSAPSPGAVAPGDIESELVALGAVDPAEAPDLAERLATELSDQLEARRAEPWQHDSEARL